MECDCLNVICDSCWDRTLLVATASKKMQYTRLDCGTHATLGGRRCKEEWSRIGWCFRWSISRRTLCPRWSNNRPQRPLPMRQRQEVQKVLPECRWGRRWRFLESLQFNILAELPLIANYWLYWIIFNCDCRADWLIISMGFEFDSAGSDFETVGVLAWLTNTKI